MGRPDQLGSPGVVGATLMAWIATAGAGLTLVATWLERAGHLTPGRLRLSRRVLVAHVGPAVIGLLLWIAYAATDTDALAWAACAVLLWVAGWGVRNFWLWQRRRAGILRATPGRWNVPPRVAGDPHIPAEQHFPVAVVALHGALGVTTFTLSVLTAAGV